MGDVKHTICLIDDDNIYQFTARTILESTGLTKEIRSFYNGSEAIKFFSNKENQQSDTLPDVIFLDINMPIMNGWEFLDEYHKLQSELPKHITLYVVSSSIDDHDMQRSKSYTEVSDFIVKPVSRIKYKELIESL
jgi:CheY-like chemotaxis protein